MNKRIVFCASLAVALFLASGTTSHARWMNPNTGRFQTMDTFEGDDQEPVRLHKYLYAADNPVNNVDPSGQDFEVLAVGGMMGAFDGFNQIAGHIGKLLVGGGAPGTGHTTVHIWNFRGSTEAWGHASMTLKDNTHISWWPSGVGRQGMPFLPQVYSAPANPDQTLAKDIQLEGQPPDKEIVITSLDEPKINTWWIAFKPTHQWKTLSQNCSTTVADGLKAGDASSSRSIWGFVRLQWVSHDIVWTPSKVEAYANAINKYH